MRFASKLSAMLVQHKSPSDVAALQLTPLDAYMANEFFGHMYINGQTGGGKSSGPLKAAFMAGAGLGASMILPCYKSGAADQYHEWAKEAGRGGDVIRWSPGTFNLNIVQYFLARFGLQGLQSVVEALCVVIDIIRQSTTRGGRESEEFWQSSTRNHIGAGIPLLEAAEGTVRLADLLRLLRTLPQSAEEAADPEWQKNSYFFQCCRIAYGKLDVAIYQRCLDYFRYDFMGLEARTRTSIHISVVTALSRLMQGILHDAFATDTTIVPEILTTGAIIILDADYARYGIDGLIYQKIILYAAQECTLPRPSYVRALRDRMVLFVLDEVQEFLTDKLVHYLAIARSHNVGVIAASQSLPTLTARMGGDNAEQRTFDFLSHFGTKIWCTSGCHISNKYASDLIGRTMQWRESHNRSQGTSTNFGMGVGEGTNWGSSSGFGGSATHNSNGSNSYGSSWSGGASSGGNENRSKNRGQGSSDGSGWSAAQQMDVDVEPGFFAYGLKSGGKANGGIVTAVWFQSGRIFEATGANHVLVSFRQ